MRRWGNVPICKASSSDHELGIQTHETLMRKEIDEVIRGTKKDLQERRVEKTISRKREVSML
jgi:hypothetical protein